MNLTKLFHVILFILPLSVYGQYIYEVDASLLNVRAGRGIGYEKIVGVPRGEEVEVIEIVDNWAEIKTKDGIKGYVAFEYLKHKGYSEQKDEEQNRGDNSSSEKEDYFSILILGIAFILYGFYSFFGKATSSNKSSKKRIRKQIPKNLKTNNMISRVKVDGNYLETIDEKGKRISRAFNNGEFLGNSSEIVVVQDGNYIEVFDKNLKIISRTYCKFDRFLGASGNSFSIQDGNYAETLDAKEKRIIRQYSK